MQEGQRPSLVQGYAEKMVYMVRNEETKQKLPTFNMANEFPKPQGSNYLSQNQTRPEQKEIPVYNFKYDRVTVKQ